MKMPTAKSVWLAQMTRGERVCEASLFDTPEGAKRRLEGMRLEARARGLRPEGQTEEEWQDGVTNRYRDGEGRVWRFVFRHLCLYETPDGDGALVFDPKTRLYLLADRLEAQRERLSVYFTDEADRLMNEDDRQLLEALSDAEEALRSVAEEEA